MLWIYREIQGKFPSSSRKLTFWLFDNTTKETIKLHVDDDHRVCDNEDPKPNESFCTWSQELSSASSDFFGSAAGGFHSVKRQCEAFLRDIQKFRTVKWVDKTMRRALYWVWDPCCCTRDGHRRHVVLSFVSSCCQKAKKSTS
jgi:hypothetical protein